MNKRKEEIRKTRGVSLIETKGQKLFCLQKELLQIATAGISYLYTTYFS